MSTASNNDEQEHTMNTTALDFPALDGRPVTEAHVRRCAERGHATHTVDGVNTGECPRCGHVEKVEECYSCVWQLRSHQHTCNR